MPISQEYLIFARGERLHVRLQIVCLSYSETLQRSGISVRLSYATSQRHNYCLRHHSTKWKSIALTNVRIFDGNRIKAPSTIVISGGLIVPALESTHASTTIDGAGGVLIPGLIDTHVHVHDLEDLAALAKHGVTTALDMGTKSLEFFPSGSLRGASGVADICSPGLPAKSADSRHGKSPHFPKHALLSGVGDTARFVSERVAEGADYIKIMVNTPGPDQANLERAGRCGAQAREAEHRARDIVTLNRHGTGGWHRRDHTRAAGSGPRREGRGCYEKRWEVIRAYTDQDARHGHSLALR